MYIELLSGIVDGRRCLYLIDQAVTIQIFTPKADVCDLPSLLSLSISFMRTFQTMTLFTLLDP